MLCASLPIDNGPVDITSLRRMSATEILWWHRAGSDTCLIAPSGFSLGRGCSWVGCSWGLAAAPDALLALYVHLLPV